MTKNEMFQKNLTLSTEFNKYLLKHPEMYEQIPQDAHLVFLPAEDSELKQVNQRLAERFKRQGEQVVYVRIKRVPKINVSHLSSPKIAVVV